MWLLRIELPPEEFGEDGDLFVATDGTTMRTERRPDGREAVAALMAAEPEHAYRLADPSLSALVREPLETSEPTAEVRRFVELLLYGLGWGQEAGDADNDLLLALSSSARELLALDAQAIADAVPASVRFRHAQPVRGVSVAWFLDRDDVSHAVVLAPTVEDACAAARHHFDGDRTSAAQIDHLYLRLSGGVAPLHEAWSRWTDLPRAPTLTCFEDGDEVGIDDGDLVQAVLAVRALARRVRGFSGPDAVALEVGEHQVVASIVQPAPPPEADTVDPDLAHAGQLFLALADAADEDDAALFHYDEAIEVAHLLPTPMATQAHLRRGALLEANDEPDYALEDYAAALSLDPQSADAHFRRGNCLAIQGELGRALEDFDRLVALRPDAEAFRLRGLVHSHLGNAQAARADEERSASLAGG